MQKNQELHHPALWSPDFPPMPFPVISDHLIDSLQHGELDVLLLALPYPAEKVETMQLFEDEFLFACPKSPRWPARSS